MPVKATKKKGRRAEAAAAVSDPALLAQLKRLRLELAKTEGVPAYVVFSDRTLIDLVNLKPANRSDFALAHGVGAKKVERYAKAFLSEIEAYTSAAG